MFGDSITLGRGVAPCRGWAGFLKDYFEAQDIHNVLYNLGVPGDSSRDLLGRFGIEAEARVKYIRESDKYIILIGIGVNDSRGMGSPDDFCVSLDEYFLNVKKIVGLAKSFTKDVVLVSLVPVDESLMPFENTFFSNEVIKKYNESLLSISEELGVLYCDVFNEFVNRDYSVLLFDGVHPNKDGYEFMYSVIKNFLVEHKLIN
ncbi:SGNH/GDSL hydrolase family protein [Candidatus Woesearchaeota archaeon]|nr:SGNH/GDSL hydrolase family protein [Candidatus Woesearchaeota archaeon]